jgi:hypothetical protein
MANFDPESAAALIDGLPEGQEQENSVREVVSQWARNDPVGAGRYLRTLSAGKARDAAIQAYCGAIVRDYPDTASQWAESIEDQKTRQRQIEFVARQWMGIDPAAARSWVTGTSLPEEIKQRILSQK